MLSCTWRVCPEIAEQRLEELIGVAQGAQAAGRTRLLELRSLEERGVLPACKERGRGGE
jgi:hypothetical protein